MFTKVLDWKIVSQPGACVCLMSLIQNSDKVLNEDEDIVVSRT